MEEKLQGLLNKAKNLGVKGKVTALSAMGVVLGATPAFAVEGAPVAPADIATSITSGLTNTANQFIEIVMAIAPIGLTMFAAVFCWKKGMKFFKQMA